MKLVIQAFEEKGDLSPEAVHTLLSTHAFPLVEGRNVTFLFRGEAERVQLRHWVYGLESGNAFRRLGASDLWAFTLDLPEASRVEYKLEITRDGLTTWEQDPLNPLLARDPFGANSVCRGEGYEEPDWTRPDPEARPGSLTDLVVSDTPMGTQRVTVYLPARFRPTRRYPLLVMHDGGDYLQYAGMQTVLDNLVHRLEVAPPVVAFTHPGERLQEYGDDPRHAEWIVRHLVPRLERQLPLVGTPAGRCLAGASFGGLAALSTAWRHPDVFGGLLLQSGSFHFTDIGANQRGERYERAVRFMNRFRDAPGRPAQRVYVSCGRYESLIYENRSLVPVLQQTGMQVRYEESRDGHNWENWRDRMRSALSWLLPGPLWMVYE